MLKIFNFVLLTAFITETNAFKSDFFYRELDDGSKHIPFYIVYMGLSSIAAILTAIVALPVFFKRRRIVRNVVHGVSYELLDFENVEQQKEWKPIKSKPATPMKPKKPTKKSKKMLEPEKDGISLSNKTL